jgi:hypothetical protein
VSSEPPARDNDLPAVGAPLGFARTLKHAATLYARRPLAYLGLFLPLCVVLVAVQYAALPDALPRGEMLGPGLILLSITVHFTLPAVAGTVVTAVAAVILRDSLAGRRTGVGPAARSLVPLVRDVLASALIAAMIALCLRLPVVQILARLIGSLLMAPLFGPPVLLHVIVLERTPLRRAWPRTRALLRGNWARLALYLMGTTLIVLVVATTLAAIGELIALSAAWLYPVLLGLLVPLLIAVAFMGYVDAREQRDGPEDSEEEERVDVTERKERSDENDDGKERPDDTEREDERVGVTEGEDGSDEREENDRPDVTEGEDGSDEREENDRPDGPKGS